MQGLWEWAAEVDQRTVGKAAERAGCEAAPPRHPEATQEAGRRWAGKVPSVSGGQRRRGEREAFVRPGRHRLQTGRVALHTAPGSLSFV